MIAAVGSVGLASAAEYLCLIGPPGSGKAPLLVGAGHAAVAASCRVRHFAAADLVETLGLADNSVGKRIDGLLRSDLIIVDELGFAPLEAMGTQLLFRFIAAAYERRSLGVASHRPLDQWARFHPNTPPPSPCSTASCPTRWWWSPNASRSV